MTKKGPMVPDEFAHVEQALLRISPEARIQALEAFIAKPASTDPLASRHLEKIRDCIAEANKRVIAGRHIDAALVWIDQAERIRQKLKELPYTRKGIEFTPKGKRLNRLSRAAVEIMQRMQSEGTPISAKNVIDALEKSGVIRTETIDSKQKLHWLDDSKKPQETSRKQFENNLSKRRQAMN